MTSIHSSSRVQKKRKVAFTYSGFLIISFTLFLTMAAFSKPLTTFMVVDGLTLGVLWGAITILIAIALTFSYARYSYHFSQQSGN